MSDKNLFLVGAGLGLVALIASAWIARRATQALVRVNPLDPNNVIYGGVNAAGQSVFGDGFQSLGQWVYDMTHSAESVTTPTPMPQPPVVPQASSTDYFSLGQWLYDTTHSDNPLNGV